MLNPQSMSPTDAKYTGRFAPSPSGQLHFGSLVTALASYLDAKHHCGEWLVRMEDIDEPRCIAGTDREILMSLEAHGLKWDGTVMYQSQQHERYKQVLNSLLDDQRAYYCSCTRKMITAMGGIYNGQCRDKNLVPAEHELAVRLKLDGQLLPSTDVIMEDIALSPRPSEDVVIKRRDQLFSYNLVVILDDAYQGVTHIIRGCDLIEVTPLHLSMYEALGFTAPQYGHVPVAAVAPGRKLSKQNHASPINNARALENIAAALQFLGFSDVKTRDFDSVDALLSYAISIWDRKKVVKTPEIIVPQHESTYYSHP